METKRVSSRGNRWVFLPTHSESRGWGGGGGGRGGGGVGGYPLPLPLFFANTKVKSEFNHVACYQGIVNSWLYYSLLGEALGGFSNP